MTNGEREHGRQDDGTEICWTLLLRPVLEHGRLPGGVDLSPPPPTDHSKCLGEYPEFRIVDSAGDCACGSIGDGKTVLDAEHYIQDLLDRDGVKAVKIAWYWGDKTPTRAGIERLSCAGFQRMNEGHSLAPDTWYSVS